jgi:SAM-dependent methyltransferase
MNGHDAKGVPGSHSEAETRRGRHGRTEHTSRSSAGAPDRLIDWTGERCVPWADDLQVIYEHYHRYLFAAPLVADRRVLDLASGEGYGAALLARRAREVVGIDIDQPSVEHSRQTYQLDNLLFNQGDMLDLSRFPDGAFDVVICFEAVEHVVDHQRLLSEIARVLSPAGLLILSTPDREVYSETQHQDNPFHVHELNREELSVLLSSHFPHVRLWGQNVAVGSVILPLGSDSGTGEVTTLNLEQGQDRWVAGAEVSPTYLVALASREHLPDLPSYSTLVDTGLELVRRSMRERDGARGDLARVSADRDDVIRSIEDMTARLGEERRTRADALAERESRVALLQRTVAERESEVALLEAQASRQDAQIERLEGSVRTLANEVRAAEIHAAEAERHVAEAEIHAAEDARALAQLNWEVGSIKASRGWRALQRLRRRYWQVRRLGRPLRRLPLFRRRSR